MSSYWFIKKFCKHWKLFYILLEWRHGKCLWWICWISLFLYLMVFFCQGAIANLCIVLLTIQRITHIANYTSVFNQTHVKLSENLDLCWGFELSTGEAYAFYGSLLKLKFISTICFKICHIPLHKFGYGKLVSRALTLWILTFLCCMPRVSWHGVGVSLKLKKKKKKVVLIFLPSQDDVFLQFKYLLILLSIAKLPLKLRSSIRTNDSVSVQRDNARGSTGLFLTAYLIARKSKIKNVCKCWHVLHTDMFLWSGTCIFRWCSVDA